MSHGIRLEDGMYSPDSWHIYCRARFIGSEDIRLPTGETITMPLSTADLDVAEFNEYMTAVEAFAADCGVYLAEAA